MKMRKGNPQRRSKGFLLMEVVLALAVFSIAATSFAVALSRIAKAAELSQHRMKVTRILQSSLNEAVSIPTLEEGKESVILDETIEGNQIEVIREVELLTGLLNENGEELTDMYHIEVRVRWFQGDDWVEESAETWRYSRLYQP